MKRTVVRVGAVVWALIGVGSCQNACGTNCRLYAELWEACDGVWSVDYDFHTTCVDVDGDVADPKAYRSCGTAEEVEYTCLATLAYAKEHETSEFYQELLASCADNEEFRDIASRLACDEYIDLVRGDRK